MQVVNGYVEAKTLLDRDQGSDDAISEGIQKRIRAIFGADLSARTVVEQILQDVKSHGDRAVSKYMGLIDGVNAEQFEIPKSDWQKAYSLLSPELNRALHVSANRITSFHHSALPKSWNDEKEGYGETIIPLNRVGLYVPGGNASYPSTVLMTAIPAKVAGVSEIIVCTAKPTTEVLAAAHLAQVDRLFSVGGAQAIGALAFGTESIPKVDKICGPGNIFVSIAKSLVSGTVDIDGLYGPTETLIIADSTANPMLCAADLLAQAEHDEMAFPVLLTDDAELADKVSASVIDQLNNLAPDSPARVSVRNNGLIAVLRSLEEAVSLANEFAPEHLCIQTKDPWNLAPKVKNAGGIFISENSPEVIGDYVAGPSHTMPTGGSARFASYLGVHHFVKHVPIIALDEKTMRKLGPSAAAIANAEGLIAHARSMQIRLEDDLNG